MPGWVDEAYQEYSRRLRAPYALELRELGSAHRSGSGEAAAQQAIDAEGRKILALLDEREYVVPLDERGTEPTTLELARWLQERAQAGSDVSFVIGGVDGLAPQVLARGNYRWSLSRLTLPHGMVRVMLAEQIYRATTVLAGHPYHRA